MLGYRPSVFVSIETMVAETERLEAADCTTDSGSHHLVASSILVAQFQ